MSLRTFFEDRWDELFDGVSEQDRKAEIRNVSCGCAVVVLLFLLLIATWVWRSSMEARAFERVTGKHVSVWDAMFVDLRVQEGARER